MTQLLVALALCYVLFKIPFWVLGSLRGGGSSLIGGMVRSYLAYKTFGLLGRGNSTGRRPPPGRAASSAAADPYARVRSDSSGQYLLPLPGLKRGRLPKPPHERYAPRRPRRPAPSASTQVRQPALFSTSGEPRKNALPPDLGPGAARHETGPGEQTMLPIHAHHHPDRTGRDRLGDAPESPPPADSAPGQPSLFTSSGRVRSSAVPPRAGRPGAQPVTVRPGQQRYLPLVGPFTSQARPEAARPTPPPSDSEPAPPSPGQQPLVRRDGQIAPGARARRPRPPAPPQLPKVYRGLRPGADGQYPLPTIPAPPRRRARTQPPPAPPPRDPAQQELPLAWRRRSAPPREGGK